MKWIDFKLRCIVFRIKDFRDYNFLSQGFSIYYIIIIVRNLNQIPSWNTDKGVQVLRKIFTLMKCNNYNEIKKLNY